MSKKNSMEGVATAPLTAGPLRWFGWFRSASKHLAPAYSDWDDGLMNWRFQPEEGDGQIWYREQKYSGMKMPEESANQWLNAVFVTI